MEKGLGEYSKFPKAFVFYIVNDHCNLLYWSELLYKANYLLSNAIRNNKIVIWKVANVVRKVARPSRNIVFPTNKIKFDIFKKEKGNSRKNN